MKALPEGTKRVNKNGYVEVKVAGLRRWPFEHRLVWEAANGPLPKEFRIHHKNEIKTDNRLDNLVLCRSNAEHHRLHHHESAVERCRKLGLAGRGRPKSPEHRAKIAAARTGQRKTTEHRVRLSASVKLAWAEGRLK